MTGVKLKEQYISYLPLLQTLNNISVIMLLRTFNIISLILDMCKVNYVIYLTLDSGKRVDFIQTFGSLVSFSYNLVLVL